MSTSSSEATRPTRSVGSQIFLASFWTILVACVLSSAYRIAFEFLGFSFLQRRSFYHITFAVAENVSEITTFVLLILSCIMLITGRKRLGYWGLFACVFGFAYISVPRF